MPSLKSSLVQPFRLLYSLGLFLVSLFFALPCHAQEGTWEISYMLVGSSSGTGDGTGTQGEWSYTPQGGALPTPGPDGYYAISSSTRAVQNSTAHASINCSPKLRIFFQWRPKGNSIIIDPPPPVASLTFKRSVKATAYAMAQITTPNAGQSGSSSCSATATWGSLTATSSASASAPQGGQTQVTDAPNPQVVTDAQWQVASAPVIGGGAIFEFDITLTSTTQAQSTIPVSVPGGSSISSASFSFQFSPMGLDMGRNNGSLGTILDGIIQSANQDPSYTRWLPLDFSPVINSAPFKGVDGNLTPLWGNAHCAYSIGIYREISPDNNGAGNYYFPPSQGGRIERNTKGVSTGYVLLDANGDRLTFNSAFQPASDIRSTFSATANDFTLSNAGPPGHLRERGSYTYKFAAFPSQNQNDPQPARLQSIEDVYGNKQTCVYPNSGGQPYLIVTDLTSNRQLLFNASNGYITELIVPYIGTTTPYVRTVLGRDSLGHVTSVSIFSGAGGPAVQQTIYQYENHTPILIQRGNIIQQMAYVSSPSLDVFGEPIRRLSLAQYGSTMDTTSDSPVGRSVSFTYGTILLGYGHYGVDSRTNTVTDARGNVTQVVYHYANPENGSTNGAINALNVTGPTLTGATDPNLTKYRYTPDMTRYTSSDITDPMNRVWSSTYHSTSGALTQFRDPVNHIWTMDWGLEGTTLLSTTDPTNITWTFQYTPNGKRLTRVMDPASRIQSEYTYNQYGQIETVSVPAATSATGQTETTTFTYDNTTGDMTQVADGTSTVLMGVFDLATRTILPNTAYDPLGDPLAFTVFPDTGNPATSLQPLTTLIEYNAAQAPVKITGPNGNSFNTVLSNGVITSINTKDSGNNLLWQASFQRDTRGRLYSVTDLVGSSLQLRYAANSNIKEYWDGRGGKTFFTYGPNNEPTQVQWPSGSSASVLYNAAGQVRQTTDERGIVKEYGYDGAARLTTLTVPSDTTLNTTYTYDDAGRVTAINAANGDSIQFNYHSTDKRLSSVTTTHNGFTYTISYTYKGDGSLATMTSPVGTTTYGYNSDKNMNSVTSPAGHVTAWTFDKLRRITSQTTTGPSGANVATYYDYGNTGQVGDLSTAPQHVKTMRHVVAGQPIWAFSLTRSYMGQLLSSVGGPGNGQTPPPSNDNEYNLYAYDNRGRLTAHDKTYTIGSTTTNYADTFEFDLANNLEGGTGGWSYNSSNQVTSAPARTMLPGATGLAYDAAGNMTTLGNFTFTWDKFGQLATANRSGTPTLNITYTYDLLGRRSTKAVNGTITERYVYDGQLLIAQLNGAGTIIRSYVWGQLGLISNRSDGVSRFYLFDPQGNTEFLIQNNNVILWAHGRYKTYGTQMGAVQAYIYGWKSQYGGHTDLDTGLVQMGAREFSPKIGRFISRDPSGYSGGPNVYAYCIGDPVNFMDVNGEWLQFVAGAAIGGGLDAGMSAFLAWRSGASSAEIWRQAMRGLARGAITGLLTAGLGPMGACASFGNAIMAGAASGAISSIVDQGIAVAMGEQDGFLWKKFAIDSIMGGLTGGLMKAGNWICFPADTPVQVLDTKSQVAMATPSAKGRKGKPTPPPVAATTTKPIQSIQVGDKVPCRDVKTGKTVFRKVSEVFQRHSDHLIAIELADQKTGKIVERLEATRQHPFFVEGKGFVPAGGLAVGNAIVTRAGPTLQVKSIKWQRRAEGWTVYNFEVESGKGEDTHNYFVGRANGGASVHNGLCPGLVGRYDVLTKAGSTWDQLTAHHMPQAALRHTARAEGCAIVLTETDHQLTRTYFDKGRQLAIDEADEHFRTVLGRDLRDLRRLFGTRYVAQIKAVIEYYRVNHPNLIARPPR